MCIAQCPLLPHWGKSPNARASVSLEQWRHQTKKWGSKQFFFAYFPGCVPADPGIRHPIQSIATNRGGLGRRDTGKIPGGPPGPVILIIIKMHKENKSREDRAAFFPRAGPGRLNSPVHPWRLIITPFIYFLFCLPDAINITKATIWRYIVIQFVTVGNDKSHAYSLFRQVYTIQTLMYYSSMYMRVLRKMFYQQVCKTATYILKPL